MWGKESGAREEKRFTDFNMRGQKKGKKSQSV